MGIFGLFKKKKKPRRSRQKVSAKTEGSVVTSDAKYGQIMKEFGVVQKELREVKQALGLLKQAEEQTYTEVKDYPANITAVIEREIGELSKRLDGMVFKSGDVLTESDGEEPAFKPTALMANILEILEAGKLASGEIFQRLREREVRVHEKSVPRALRKLIEQGAVRAVPGGAANLYEKN